MTTIIETGIAALNAQAKNVARSDKANGSASDVSQAALLAGAEYGSALRALNDKTAIAAAVEKGVAAYVATYKRESGAAEKTVKQRETEMRRMVEGGVAGVGNHAGYEVAMWVVTENARPVGKGKNGKPITAIPGTVRSLLTKAARWCIADGAAFKSFDGDAQKALVAFLAKKEPTAAQRAKAAHKAIGEAVAAIHKAGKLGLFSADEKAGIKVAIAAFANHARFEDLEDAEEGVDVSSLL